MKSNLPQQSKLPFDSNKFSCNECKRRRIKCSRQIPVCASCLKYKRHCLYEKHRKTPLTRKHLTEIEEELNLVKQLLLKHIPETKLTSLLNKLRNGNDVHDIPNLYSDFDNNSNEVCPDKNDSQKILTNNQKPHEETSRTTSVNIQSLLADNDIQNNNNTNNYCLINEIDGSGFSAENTGDFQIAQILPPCINITKNSRSNLNTHPLRRKQVEKQVDLSPNSINSNYSWDERSQADGNRHNRQPSIIDGMATTEKSGYLGTSSSAALISLLGSGFFLYDKKIQDYNNSNSIVNSPMSSGSFDSLAKKINKQKMEYYIDQYFETYHISYPIIHKPIFLAQFNEIIPSPGNGWESLLYIVAAIGSFMSATSPEENDDLELFDKAKSKLSIEVLETGNITLVQTLTLMSNYLQKRDRPNSGYNYLGLAVRMALGLGMHKQIEEIGESLLDQEMRRRVWWCLYIFDCGQTITYGRPLGIPCAGIDARLPSNIMDSDLTARTQTLPEEEDQPTIFTSVRLQSLFHLLTNSIYERIITDPFPSAQILLEWDKKYIERWRILIPDYFKEGADVSTKFKLAHAVLEWRYRNLKIIMYRTFLLKNVILNSETLIEDDCNEYEIKSGEICLRECSATINSMAQFWELKPMNTRMDAWYSLYFLIPAVLMPLVCLRNNPASTCADYWRYDIISAQKIIRTIMNICPSASKILDLINSLGSGYVTTQNNEEDNVLAYATTGTDESPLSQLNQLHCMLWPVSFDIEQQFL